MQTSLSGIEMSMIKKQKGKDVTEVIMAELQLKACFFFTQRTGLKTKTECSRADLSVHYAAGLHTLVLLQITPAHVVMTRSTQKH